MVVNKSKLDRKLAYCESLITRHGEASTKDKVNLVHELTTPKWVGVVISDYDKDGAPWVSTSFLNDYDRAYSEILEEYLASTGEPESETTLFLYRYTN